LCLPVQRFTARSTGYPSGSIIAPIFRSSAKALFRRIAMSEAVIRPIDLERDCALLADLFNESEPAWPGGFTDGIPLTEAEIRDWMRDERTLVTLVAEADGRLVGFCSFLEGTPWPSGQYGSGYLDLLNVHPDYHGNSIGRRLLQATIEYSVKQGWVYQTLGTWSANYKAVPAYKRTGHFWRPDSSVWMQNYIPGALQMPIAMPFFERHDWYRSYVRTIEQHQDDERWEGLKVYREHWEADGEALTIWIDREANAPCAVETDQVLVAAIPEDIEPLQGTSVRMNWRVTNKTDHAIHVYVNATGADGLSVDHREAFTVPGGLSVDHAATVQVTDKAPHAKPDGIAPSVRSVITLDHNEVELFSGLRARKPLSIDTDPENVSLSPGVPTAITLQVHSELPEGVRATCYLQPPAGVTLDRDTLPVSLEGGGHAALPLVVTAAAGGVLVIPVRLVPEREGLEPVREELTLFCVAPGTVASRLSGEDARIETDALRYEVSARLGQLTVTHKGSESTPLKVRPSLGPPYYPGDFDRRHFQLRLEASDGRVTVCLEAEPEHYADTLMRLSYTICANDLVTAEASLQNLGGETFSGLVSLDVSWQDSQARDIILPLKEGTVRAPLSEYPRSWTDAPRDPSEYAEPWAATELRGHVAAMAWDRGTASLRFTSGEGACRSEQVDLARGERTDPLRCAFWVGRGDWKIAREMLMRWAGIAQPGSEDRELTTRPVVRATPGWPVVATLDDHLDVDVTVDSVSIRPMHGTLYVRGTGGLHAEPAEAPILRLQRDNRQVVPVRLSVPERCGGYQGEARLELQAMTSVTPFGVLRLGRRGEVSVDSETRAGRPVWKISNGESTFAVGEDFGPSLISWLWRGQEQVVSPFPEPAPFAWSYPYYHGVQFRLWLDDDAEACGNLVDERFAAQPVAVQSGGLNWLGLRLTARPERKELHDLSVEIDYLTLPYSPVLKGVLRVTNLRATRQQALVGGSAQLSLGADMRELHLRGEQYAHQPMVWGNTQRGRTWGILHHPESGAALLGVSPQRRLDLSDQGRYGRSLSLRETMRLPGGAVRELELYMVRCDDLAMAQSLRSLALL